MRRSVAARLQRLVHDAAGLDLPVRIRAWDGSEAGPSEGPALVIRNRRALRRLLWAPGELGLARAYVTGEAIVALCGKKWVPTRDPSRYPICPTCVERKAAGWKL